MTFLILDPLCWVDYELPEAAASPPASLLLFGLYAYRYYNYNFQGQTSSS